MFLLIKKLLIRLPVELQRPLYPVRARCLPCTPCGAGLAAGMKTIPFSANPVRDLFLNGADTGLKASCEPSR